MANLNLSNVAIYLILVVMRLNNLLPHRLFRVHLKSFEVVFNSRPISIVLFT